MSSNKVVCSYGGGGVDCRAPLTPKGDHDDCGRGGWRVGAYGGLSVRLAEIPACDRLIVLLRGLRLPSTNKASRSDAD